MEMAFDEFIRQISDLDWSSISRKIYDELDITEQRMPLTDFAQRVSYCSLNISILLLREYNNWLMEQLGLEANSNE
jgi:hypothetical protein